MGDYAITFTRSARKELEKLPTQEIKKIFQKITALSVDPRPKGCQKLVGEDYLRRIRVGNYRVVYTINDRQLIVDIITKRHRSAVYQ